MSKPDWRWVLTGNTRKGEYRAGTFLAQKTVSFADPYPSMVTLTSFPVIFQSGVSPSQEVMDPLFASYVNRPVFRICSP